MHYYCLEGEWINQRPIILNHRKAETPGSLIQVTVVSCLPLVALYLNCRNNS